MAATRTSKKNDFIAQGSTLAIASILVRVIGMIYRIPMTAIIGDEGNSLYSYAYSIYTILLLLSSYSLPLAVSKMVSAKTEKGEWRNVQRIFQCALLFGLCIGTFFALLVLLGGRAFTNLLYHDDLAAIPLRLMAPTILIMSMLGVFRGFFQGLQTTAPTAISQLLEQVVNAIFSVLFSYLLFHYGESIDAARQVTGFAAAWGAAGGTIGTGAGAAIALVFLILLYSGNRRTLFRGLRTDHSGKEDSYTDIFKLLLSIAIPVILSTALYNMVDLIDGSLFSYYMSSIEAEEIARQRIWGAYSGKALTMVHIPVSISSAMAVSLVPTLTAAVAAGRKKQSVYQINLILKFTGTVAFPSAVGLAILASPIIRTLYRADASSASTYLMVASLAVVAFSFSTITNSILQGVNRMTVPVLHSCIALAVHIVVVSMLMYVFHIGIYGIIIGYALFGALITVLNFRSLRLQMNYRCDYFKVFLLPLLCSAIMGVVCFAVYHLLNRILGGTVSMLISIVVSIAVYFVCIVRLHLMTERDMLNLPKGRKLVSLARKLHLL